MKTCENCSSLNNGSYGSGRFCSSKCAKAFSTKNKRIQINEKVSLTLTQDPILKICPNCTDIFKTKRKNKTFCSRKCQGEFVWKDNENRIIMTEAARNSAIARHKAGDSTIGWKMRKNRQPSYPEQTFIFLLDELKILYDREYKIGKYFIDFAFHDKKIALEIDGRRHEDTDIKIKDLEKENFIFELGWTTFRIKWKTPQEARKQLMEFLIKAELV